MREQWKCLGWAVFAIAVFAIPTTSDSAKYLDWYMLMFAGFQLGKASEISK